MFNLKDGAPTRIGVREFMKPYEIALFKHFLESKGMVTIWINTYRRNHLKKNPISIEEYLTKAEPEKVIMDAFIFFTNTDYGFDYWDKMTVMWMDFYDANKNNYTADEWYLLKGTSQILRTNWDAAAHWKMESRLTAAIRLGIDPALIGAEGKTPTAPPTKMSEEFLREKTRNEIANMGKGATTTTTDDGNEPLLDFSSDDTDAKKDDDTDATERMDIKTYVKGKDEEDKKSILGEFTFLDVSRAGTRRRLKDDEVSVNLRDNHSRMTFNQKISGEIKKRGGYEYAALLKNKKGDVALILNDEKGVPLQDGCTRTNGNVMIGTRAFVDKVVEFLGIKTEYEIIKVTEIERTNDYVAYLLSNK